MEQNKNSDSVMEPGNHFKNGTSLKSLMNKGLIVCIIVPLFLASCSTAKIYTRPDAMAYTAKHRTLAILPPEVKMEIKKKTGIEVAQEQAKVETLSAQNEMYSRLLTFVQKRNLRLEIQDIEKTNATLSRIGNTDEVTAKMTPEELAKALGVDVVLQSNYVFSQQRNTGMGIAYAIVFFPYGTPWGIMMATNPTNLADVNMRFFDGTTGSLIYSYNNKSGGLNAKYSILVDGATKHAGKKSPYYRK